MLKALYQIVEWLGQTTPVFRMVVLAGTTVASFTAWLNQVWADLFLRVDNYVKPTMEGVADFSPLGLANYIAPIDTLLTLIVVYMSVRLATVSIRIVKSFVPTIA